MTGLIILACVFIFAGIYTRWFYLWGVSAIPMLILSVNYFNKYSLETTNFFYKAMGYSSLSLAVIFLALGIILQISYTYENNKLSDGTKDFYSEFEY